MSRAGPLRVAILGTASSGKSTLAAALAAHYHTVWVPEYLREFVDTEARVPQAADQFPIARTQLAREEQAAARAGKYLFCDTTPLMTAVYSRHYFLGIDPQLAVLADQHHAHYDVTLVTAPDLPWVPEGLQRECEQVSIVINELLMEELAARSIPYRMVAGSVAERVASVVALVQA
jgi:NadR type nicotinamide-nucleotide adenylyltransferase